MMNRLLGAVRLTFHQPEPVPQMAYCYNVINECVFMLHDEAR